MKTSPSKNVHLSFTEQTPIADIHPEQVQDIPLTELHPFKNHPFHVRDDEVMAETVESIQQYGVLVPAIARPDPNGGYELIAGHRRLRASELAGRHTLPVIVREMDDDEATLVMVDSNLQRENLLPSERAFAYKMKLAAMKRQGQRTDLTSAQVGRKLNGKESRELLAEQVGESRNQISRFIHLTLLIPALLEQVDEHHIGINPAYELSFLKPAEQECLLQVMEDTQSTPSLSQAQRIKRFSQEGKLTEGILTVILCEQKKPPRDQVTLESDTLRRYFPRDYTPRQMEDVIVKLLEQWRCRQQNRER